MNLNDITLPAAIGAPLAGGYFAGLILVDNAPHALIVAPKAVGETTGRWDPAKAIDAAKSFNDGQANTAAMAAAGSKLAAWANGIDHDGHKDWYIPSRDELELVYRNLKPTAETNAVHRHGENPSAVPPTYPYTESSPAQTTVEAFREGGQEALEDTWYWSSTQHASDTDCAWSQFFGNGYQDYDSKSYEGRARAVRRLAI